MLGWRRMLNPIYALSDRALTTGVLFDSVLTLVIGFIVSLEPPKKKQWKRLLCSGFIGLCLFGILLSREQSRRSDLQSRALLDAQQRTSEAISSSTSKMNGVHDVLVQMSKDLKSQIIETAAKQIAAIAANQITLSERVMPVATSSPGSAEKPLLDRALAASSQLQGFQAHWSDAFDKMDGEVKTRWTSPYYTSASAQRREEMIEGDRRVMRWREDEINREQTTFYRKNYEPALESLRRELIPLVPAGNTGVDYDNRPGTYASFLAICSDFDLLVKEYSKISKEKTGTTRH